ncbi:MAG: phosphonoacetaldehyde reductase [Clostridiales bacterium]|nr:phosphonoacetaldehyde reductase [Clostridiales bacterium]
MQTKGVILNSFNEIKGACFFNKPFLCCSSSFKKTQEYEYLCSNFNLTVWDKVRPNPRYEDMLSAAQLFRLNGCDFIIGAGGGSVIDSAKMIKLLATNEFENALEMPMQANGIKLLAVPTTSGTGSEATRYSIFYVNENVKHSIAHSDFLPDFVILDEKFIKTVPPYQRRCTCLDALCHAIESYWNTKSNAESKEYAKKAIELFTKHKNSYINNEDSGNKGMLAASYYAGKAINITSTTAAHAMCYNITMNCSTAHGHSVALVLAAQWKYMNENNSKLNDSRGGEYLLKTFDEIAHLLGGKNSAEGAAIFSALISEFRLDTPSISAPQLAAFSHNVNMPKLVNNPTALNQKDVFNIYSAALSVK